MELEASVFSKVYSEILSQILLCIKDKSKSEIDQFITVVKRRFDLSRCTFSFNVDEFELMPYTSKRIMNYRILLTKTKIRVEFSDYDNHIYGGHIYFRSIPDEGFNTKKERLLFDFMKEIHQVWNQIKSA